MIVVYDRHYTSNKGMVTEVINDLVNEPVTLLEAKDWCAIDGNDRDSLITALITTARMQLEQLSNKSFGAKTIKLYLDEYGRDITLPYGPVDSVSLVTSDGTTVTTDHYELLASRKLRIYTGSNNLVVTYTTKSTIPEAWKQAVKCQVAFLLENKGDSKEAGIGLSSEAEAIMGPYMTLNVF